MPRTFFNEVILFFRGYRNALSKGECYEQGKHVEKDIPAAIACYEHVGWAELRSPTKLKEKSDELSKSFYSKRQLFFYSNPSEPKRKNFN